MESTAANRRSSLNVIPFASVYTTDLGAWFTALMEVQEEERRRISQELHDDLGQRLALLEIQIDQVQQGCLSPDAFVNADHVVQMFRRAEEQEGVIILTGSMKVEVKIGEYDRIERERAISCSISGAVSGFSAIRRRISSRCRWSLSTSAKITAFQAVKDTSNACLARRSGASPERLASMGAAKCRNVSEIFRLGCAVRLFISPSVPRTHLKPVP
jgi:hypothetical protein